MSTTHDDFNEAGLLHDKETPTMNPTKTVILRWAMVASLVAGVFFAAYAVAQSASTPEFTPPAGTTGATGQQAGYGAAQGDPAACGSSSGACAGCGTGAPTEGGVTGEPLEGSATVDGDVQRISVDVTTGIYQPNVIRLVAGVPAEIAFSEGSGCTAQVMSDELGFFEDLSAGGATVALPALQPGEYSFSCGMRMVFGKIIVE